MKFRTFCLVALTCLSSFSCSAEESKNKAIKGKFVPPDNKLLMFIGQDSDTISDYVRDVPEDNLEAVTLYTQLKSNDLSHALKGVFEVGNWQSGDVDYSKTLSQAPGAALAIGLAYDACNDIEHAQKIAAGDYDDALNKLVDYLKSIAPRKVFLRAGYEFDGMWNCYNPESHKAAFRHIAKAMKNGGADNVAMVWQSAAWPSPQFAGDRTHLYDHNDPNHIEKWYPGDDVVDWVSISVFYRDLSVFNFETTTTPAKAQQLYLDFARQRGKPIMISESAPQGYRTEKQTKSPIGHNVQTPHSAQQIWQDWYVPYFEFIYQNQDVIKATAYINTHWEEQPRWYCAPDSRPPAEDCPEGNWGDSRVQGHAYIKKQWLEHVNNADIWVQRGDY